MLHMRHRWEPARTVRVFSGSRRSQTAFPVASTSPERFVRYVPDGSRGLTLEANISKEPASRRSKCVRMLGTWPSELWS